MVQDVYALKWALLAQASLLIMRNNTTRTPLRPFDLKHKKSVRTWFGHDQQPKWLKADSASLVVECWTVQGAEALDAYLKSLEFLELADRS